MTRHKLLRRQIRRHLPVMEHGRSELQPLLDAIDAAYQHADDDRAMLEHSLDIMSQELQERYSKLLAEEARTRTLAANRELTAIVERAGVGLCVSDMGGRIVQANPAFCEFMGIPEKDLLGRPTDALSPAEEAPRTHEAVRQLMAEDEVSVEVERRFLHADGGELTGRLTLTLVRSEGGDPLNVMGVVQDITSQKRLERELLEKEEQLRQSLKMEAVGRLAGGIAHDFNNLLTVISARTELLRSVLEESHPGWEDVEEIHSAARRAAELTGQLLAFSRRQVLAPETLDLDHVLSGFLPFLSSLIGDGIEVAVDVEDDLSPVHTDAGQLQQVLMNLAVNARDAMPGGGQIEITACCVDFEGTADLPPGRYVRLRMVDNGVGMSEAVLARVLEPFYTTKEPGKGTGLGLAMVHGIVRQSGGDVVIESTEGEGTAVSVYLPGVAPGGSGRSAPADAGRGAAEPPR